MPVGWIGFLVFAAALAGLRVQAGWPPMPFEEGTKWTYRLTGRCALEGQGPRCGRYESLWTMEVIEGREAKGHRILLVKGSVFDIPSVFDWEKRKPEPMPGILVLDPQGGLHAVECQDLLPAWREGPETLLGRLDGESLLFRWPAKPGDAWTEAPGGHEDGRYRWTAEGWTNLRRKIKGWHGEERGLRIAYRTNPDHQVFTFVPGLGVASFEYGHHGTVGEFRAQLLRIERPETRKEGKHQ